MMIVVSSHISLNASDGNTLLDYAQRWNVWTDAHCMRAVRSHARDGASQTRSGTLSAWTVQTMSWYCADTKENALSANMTSRAPWHCAEMATACLTCLNAWIGAQCRDGKQRQRWISIWFTVFNLISGFQHDAICPLLDNCNFFPNYEVNFPL